MQKLLVSVPLPIGASDLKKRKQVMYHDAVNTFIEACDQDISNDNINLYLSLIEEEHNEFLQAVSDKNDTEQLDACMDMIWVILGYCYMKQFDVAGAWNEVTQSNLSKIDSTTGKVVKREDGKVLKPEGWQQPNFGKYVKNS